MQESTKNHLLFIGVMVLSFLVFHLEYLVQRTS